MPKNVCRAIFAALLMTTSASVPCFSQDQPVKDKWAVVIGISKFRTPGHDLHYAAKDAQDFYTYLVNEAHFQPDHIALLLDEQATRENILTAFGSKWLPNMAEPGDLVVIFVSTHGTPANADNGGRNYIVAHDTEADNCYATGVDMDELMRRMKEGVKTDRVLIVLDTCFSGGAVPGTRSLGAASNFDLTKLPIGKGHLVISSSSVGEASWESRRYQNGVFTKNLLDSLRGNSGAADVKNAYAQTKIGVEREVRMDDGAHQTPQFGGDWQGAPLIISARPSEPRKVYRAFTPSHVQPLASAQPTYAPAEASPPPVQPTPSYFPSQTTAQVPRQAYAPTYAQPVYNQPPATYAQTPSYTQAPAYAQPPAQSSQPSGFAGRWSCDTLGEIVFRDLGGGRVRGDFQPGANAQGYFDGVVVDGVFTGIQKIKYFGEDWPANLVIKKTKPYLFRGDWTSPSGKTGYYNGAQMD